MRTKTADSIRMGRLPATAADPALSMPGAEAYWLEDALGHRVSKLFRTSDRPLRLAARVLENLGHVDGWTVAWRDVNGARRVHGNQAMQQLIDRIGPKRLIDFSQNPQSG